ncbi:hypothetical protein RRF57_001411 [Xylaria bambusicola]|uniref:Rhodopsin domain-containing protein n=1 Tax=Xylaria bambusicola TaxID=326684 RepID=A0AAN7U4V9_9PEZI
MAHQDLSQVPISLSTGMRPSLANARPQQVLAIVTSAVTLALAVVFVTTRIYTSIRIYHGFHAEKQNKVIAMNYSYFRSTAKLTGITLLATIFSVIYIGIVLSSNLSLISLLLVDYRSNYIRDIPMIWYTEEHWKLNVRFPGNYFQEDAHYFSRVIVLMLYDHFLPPRFRLLFHTLCLTLFNLALHLTTIYILTSFNAPSTGIDRYSPDAIMKFKTLLDWSVIHGSLDIALDLCVFALPLPTILQLHMPTRIKISVLTILCTGFFVAIATGTEFYFYCKLVFTSYISYNDGAYICAA